MDGPPQSRLAYIDWMRGLACVLMFQTHCYDSWLRPDARNSTFFMWSQLGGTFPAPLFLFLAGLSFALVTDKLRQTGATPNAIARTTILRGAEIFGLGLLFRLQEFTFGFPWAPWTDLLRVDVLNIIGLSMVLMGTVCWGVLSRTSGQSVRATLSLAAVAIGLLISMVTPLVWTTWRAWLHRLPWPIESYLDGVHNLGEPQGWIFPLFPWSAFAFIGLSAGFVLLSDWAKARTTRAFLACGIAGGALIVLARWLDARPRQIYPVYDFWRTSPNFFLIRLGILLMILFGSYMWCKWGWGQQGFSPLVQLGQTSLLVYWVHIEFVYGRLSFLKKHEMGIRGASIGFLIICMAMLLLSVVRTHYKRQGSVYRPQFRRTANAS